MMKSKKLVITALFTALLTLGAYLQIPMPPVPITTQYLFVALAGLMLGAKNALLAALCYVLIGLFGLPVFSGGGGFGYVLKPTFGYLLGFIVAAWAVGKLSNKANGSFLHLFLASAAGVVVVYVMGIAYFVPIQTLYLANELTAESVFYICVLLTLPGDILNCLLAALIAKRLNPILNLK